MREIVRKYRLANGLTQADLAAMAGVTQGYISRIEREGEKNPTLEVLEALAKALGITVGILIGEENENA